jgi:hypothetical protein
LGKIKNIPLAFFSGDFDVLANPKDVGWLNQELKSEIVFSKNYPIDHLSFVVGKDMTHMNNAIEVLNKYSSL